MDGVCSPPSSGAYWAAGGIVQAGAAAVEHVIFPDSGGGPPGYGRLARHYKWALSSVFAKPGEPPRFRRWHLGLRSSLAA